MSFWAREPLARESLRHARAKNIDIETCTGFLYVGGGVARVCPQNMSKYMRIWHTQKSMLWDVNFMTVRTSCIVLANWKSCKTSRRMRKEWCMCDYNHAFLSCIHVLLMHWLRGGYVQTMGVFFANSQIIISRVCMYIEKYETDYICRDTYLRLVLPKAAFVPLESHEVGRGKVWGRASLGIHSPIAILNSILRAKHCNQYNILLTQ